VLGVRAIVLGSGAGGGYPQWNCRCAVCELYWRGDPRVSRRTQSSLAVSPDGRRWALLNCSPDIREQIGSIRALWPDGAPRGTPISDIVVTNGDADHVGGLLSLREQTAFTLWGTEEILSVIAANPMFGVLDEAVVRRRALGVGSVHRLDCGLSVQAFMSPGKVPLYMESAEVKTDMRSPFTVGVKVWADPARAIAYVPGCGAIDGQLLREIDGAAALLFDGTVWQDDEMSRAGVGTKTGRRMGHIPVNDAQGPLEAFRNLTCGRRILVHINNTNPLLVASSAERLQAEKRGWEVGFDGMEIEL
jgi:pyrroloquinoline quinone biosynthesis protein B